jgi:ferredoxin
MKSTRKIIKIDTEKCDGCGLCVPSCAEGAIRIVNGRAELVAEKYCDGLGACLGECPQGALLVVDAEVEPFDELAAKKHVAGTPVHTASNTHSIGLAPSRMLNMAAPGDKTLPCGCPSASMQTFAPPAAGKNADSPAGQTTSTLSALTHWPVQIRLIPPTAPFLRDADLLVAADCVPVAYAGFHNKLLHGKSVLLGCPKFDDAEEYVNKFAAIFTTANIKSITVAVMEVPCCQGLPVIVRKGMEQAGKKIPISVVVISARGEIMD